MNLFSIPFSLYCRRRYFKATRLTHRLRLQIAMPSIERKPVHPILHDVEEHPRITHALPQIQTHVIIHGIRIHNTLKLREKQGKDDD